MNKRKLLWLTLPALAATFYLSTVTQTADSDSLSKKEVKVTQIAAQSEHQNGTIQSILEAFPTQAEFEEVFVNPDASRGVTDADIDATVVLFDSIGEEGKLREDTGWTSFPPGVDGENYVTDADGNVLKVFSRNDPQAATIAEIRAAYAAQDNGQSGQN
ncbi:MAG: hypothetical protein LBV19_10465 [Streptococcaceae bacterium]|nr:hypothetical protein [Streptococcaceae bacterium]